MKKILIADANKASLVMTSEIFKDQYPGIQICTAHTAADAIGLVRSQKNFDAFVIDFDLPDLNGAHTALKIKKISKKPVLITAFENQYIVDTIETKFDPFGDCKNFLKKPLQSDVVRALCELYCKGNVKFQKSVPANLSAIVNFIVPSQPKTTKKSSQLKSISCSIIIEECALNTMKFKFCSIETSDPSMQSFDMSNIKNMHLADQIKIRFQDPYEIELGQNLTWNQIAQLRQHSLCDIFRFELTGKILEKANHPVNRLQDNKPTSNVRSRIDPDKLGDAQQQSFWVEFDNVLLAKRIFEALMREKMHEQFKIPNSKWYLT